VLGHVVWALRRIAASAEGLDAPPEMAESEVIGSDPVATWNEALHTAIAALDRQGVLGRVVTGSFGTATIDAVLGFYPSDLLAHAWDIATTAGQDPHLPAALCERFAVNLAAAGAEVRGPGRMAEAVVVPADADAVTRFIAQTGRTP
jgi:uncharacterized protein (TIGR03086 family)